MSWVTHEMLIAGQLLGAAAYSVASYRLWHARFNRLTLFFLCAGVVLDVLAAVIGSTSGLGDNPEGTPWRHPLFGLAVVLATLGMLGYMLCVPLLWQQCRHRPEPKTAKSMNAQTTRTTLPLAQPGEIMPDLARRAKLLRDAQCILWPSWMAGVALFIVNVYAGWF